MDICFRKIRASCSLPGITRRHIGATGAMEAVRRLHNSETNCRRYEPEQGLISPHNEAVTSYLLGAISASPDLHDVDKDDIVSACKTCYETVRRSFRYTQPENSLQAEAAKSSARSRARRKRLLESRQSVLADDEVELWKSATVDLMSDEEDGVVGGVSTLLLGICQPITSDFTCLKVVVSSNTK
ncbi:uncharacterized protein C14orf93 homolog [Alosa sapidissima]|uniref:uncharacterized protein C14orf93 homolog n=1 Tax=Alosa sapidissima TaxID=34773 RepID=UPI001C0A4608|nr:uncharacterized protein C14orf93 homolog [Alosa sapidissima]